MMHGHIMMRRVTVFNYPIEKPHHIFLLKGDQNIFIREVEFIAALTDTDVTIVTLRQNV